MCISCIGGTVDVSAHEVHSNGTLATISAPSGGHWGGTLVDKHMYDFFWWNYLHNTLWINSRGTVQWINWIWIVSLR